VTGNVGSNFFLYFQRLETVFSCIEDITELTITLISMVEDNVEISEPNQVYAVGFIILELAEVRSLKLFNQLIHT